MIDECRSYPAHELIFEVLVWEVLSHAIGIVKGPHSQLVQHSQFGEDVEVSKMVGLVFVAVGMRFALGLVVILGAYRLVPVVKPGMVSA